MLRAIELVDEIAAQPQLRRVLRERVNPGLGVDRSSLADWVRAEAQHMYHAAGSVRMGLPDDGAVDSRLCVYGVDGLRVIDASVMPRITSGNTNAPAIMIGEVGAELILG